MWVRSAFWVGQVKPGEQSNFRQLMDAEIVPALARLPGVLGARAYWPVDREDNPPGIALQVVVDFNDREDIDKMLASPERAAMRARVMEVAQLFEGEFSHINYEVG